MSENLANVPVQGDYLSAAPPEFVEGYDNMPVSDHGTHPRRSRNHWRIPIDQVSPQERDRRFLAEPMEQILEICGKYPPLDKPGERTVTDALIRAYKDGDEIARDKLILHNLRYVVYLAKRARRNLDMEPESLPDLVGYGIFGLVDGIENSIRKTVELRC